MVEEERVSGSTFFQDIADRLAVAGGGMRVRIFDGGAEGIARGRTPGPPPERVLKLVLELGPGCAGTVDLRNVERPLAHPRERDARRRALRAAPAQRPRKPLSVSASLVCARCRMSVPAPMRREVAAVCPRCGGALEELLTFEATPRAPQNEAQAVTRAAESSTLGAGIHTGGTRAIPPEVQQARADPRRTLGRFVMLSELGRGGMGVVYKAWDDTLGRLVALKLLGPNSSGDALQRFRREAHTTAALRHPSIVSVHDAGEVQGRPFLVMDLIDGSTLDRKIKDRALPLSQGIEVVKAVARAIQYAHEHGVVHRDLKPQNIMLTPGGHPYVLDFGLAVLRSSESVLTKSGATLGTIAYMPPSRWRRRAPPWTSGATSTRSARRSTTSSRGGRRSRGRTWR